MSADPSEGRERARQEFGECSKCHTPGLNVKKIGKGSYCDPCWAKIGPKYPPRAKDAFEFYDKIYHPTTGNPPATWEFAEAYAEYRLNLKVEVGRSLEQERGFVTPDGSASTHPRDQEWAEALNAAGGIQIESFSPITVINIAAVHKGDS